MFVASQKGHADTVDVLARAGVYMASTYTVNTFQLIFMHFLDMCIFTKQNGFSPVYIASQNGHADTVDVLVKAGADVNLANIDLVISTSD